MDPYFWKPVLVVLPSSVFMTTLYFMIDLGDYFIDTFGDGSLYAAMTPCVVLTVLSHFACRQAWKKIEQSQ